MDNPAILLGNLFVATPSPEVTERCRRIQAIKLVGQFATTEFVGIIKLHPELYDPGRDCCSNSRAEALGRCVQYSVVHAIAQRNPVAALIGRRCVTGHDFITGCVNGPSKKPDTASASMRKPIIRPYTWH